MDKQPAPTKPQTHKVNPYHWYNHTEWAAEAWTGNNTPYQKARTQIDYALSESPQSGKILLAKYTAAAKANPASPLALFRWAYASLKLDPQPHYLGEDGLDAVRDAFAKPPSPHTYDYTRLRFLLFEHSMPIPELIPLGRRLLKQQPIDYPVHYYYIASLRVGPTIKDSQLALLEVDKLLQQQPNTISLYALKGSIYLGRWAGEKSNHLPKKADGESCIAAYQEYLDRSPTNDPFRKSAQDVIDWVRTR